MENYNNENSSLQLLKCVNDYLTNELNLLFKNI